METKQLNFDVARGGVQHRLFVRVGDLGSRTVVAKFHSGGEPISVTAAEIRILRPDGTEILAACDVNDNVVSYTFTGGEDTVEGETVKVCDLAIEGEYSCEYILHNGVSVMTSPQLIVYATDVLFDGDGVASSDSYKAYLAALAKLQTGNFTVSAESGDNTGATVTIGTETIHIDFVIPRGERGKDGEKGDAFTYDDFTEEQLAALKPIKGVDYWTPVEASEIENAKNAANAAADRANTEAEKVNQAVSDANAATVRANEAATAAGSAADAANSAVSDLTEHVASGAFDGYTPKRGTDYWTPDDISEIKSYVDDAILGGAW